MVRAGGVTSQGVYTNMEELKLTSNRKGSIKPIVEAALENELRIVESGIRRTQRNLMKFEQKHNIETQTFIAEYEDDNLPENLEYIDWIGEFRMLSRLKEKADALKSIHIEN